MRSASVLFKLSSSNTRAMIQGHLFRRLEGLKNGRQTSHSERPVGSALDPRDLSKQS
jgi:hypothetical protein